MHILEAFYVNKTFVNHGHQNPSSPNTSITYYMGAVKYSDGKYFEPP